ncbi:hypothetical protein CLV46_2152 [Diaminobutyricimonas aerilata]|uniref:Uncharacterized protein n=1 Tax=Diaminobutyricimonas aerilata TaxID=1162967 RepID=A0A2M9CL15_9MICO|nr:hypothetical protein [Diaminobutyricimonas aerilata]PJJ72580.1 hypothetical protein CLV46_2152 [Diaminobutyricimonas aerilata]
MSIDRARDDAPREYEPNLEDERVVPLLDDDDEPLPPPTIDPDERVETDIEDGDVSLDDERRD